MTIRRISVFIAFLVLTAFAASGQTLYWQGASSLSQPLPSYGNCQPGNNTCWTTSSTINIPLTVSSAPSGTPVYSVATGNLPAGVNLSSGGLLTGSPTTGGLYTVTFKAVYPSQTVTSQSYVINVPGGTFSVSQTPLPTNAVAGTAVNAGGTTWYTATATGGTPFTSGGSTYYNWSINGPGSNPDGLTIGTQTGIISGIPTTASGSPFTVIILATDSLGATATFSTTLTVAAASGFFISTTSLPNGSTAIPYSQLLTQSGGPSNGVTWSLTSGTLPPGLTLATNSNSTATISGTPTSSGTYNFNVQASYTSGSTFTANQALSIVVTLSATLALPNPSPVSGILGQALSMQFSATGGTQPYNYRLQSGTIPVGLSLNSTSGTLSGTPTQIGTSTFVVQVTDANNLTATATGTITILTKLTMVNPPTATASLNQNVSVQFTASGGTPTYTYSLQTGVLPPGTVLNQQTGQISGVATQVGVYTFTVLVNDSSVPTQAATATGTISIATPITMANPANGSGIVGQSLSVQFTATGGTGPYTYLFQAGTLPSGTTLDPVTGLVTGTLTQAGPFVFVIQAKDSTGSTTTAQGTVNVVLANISNVTITPSGPLALAKQIPITVSIGAPINQQVTGSLQVVYQRAFDGQGSREVVFTNGVQFINFTIPAGQTRVPLPANFALITGTATGAGQISVSFRDSLGNNITAASVQPVIFSIAGTAPVISSFKISQPINGIYTATVSGYSSTLSMTTGVFTFTATSGTNLASSTVTVPLSTAFANWYGTSQSNQYGGQFSLTVPFAFSVANGVSTNPIAAATVALTNSVGTTTSASANPQ